MPGVPEDDLSHADPPDHPPAHEPPIGPTGRRGDADIAAIGALLGDPGRARVLMALNDGRALPASLLATEAGVAASTASSHLGKLLAGGLLTVEQHGRNRYYRLAGPKVGQLLEILTQLAPTQPVRSLRQDTRAQQLRAARSCYDHDIDYQLSADGHEFLTDLGVTLPPRRPVIRYCIDWSEQCHHLAGTAGRGLLNRLIELDWIRRGQATRAVRITDTGRDGLHNTFGIPENWDNPS